MSTLEMTEDCIELDPARYDKVDSLGYPLDTEMNWSGRHIHFALAEQLRSKDNYTNFELREASFRHVMTECRNPLCNNPDHLIVYTYEESGFYREQTNPLYKEIPFVNMKSKPPEENIMPEYEAIDQILVNMSDAELEDLVQGRRRLRRNELESGPNRSGPSKKPAKKKQKNPLKNVSEALKGLTQAEKAELKRKLGL